MCTVHIISTTIIILINILITSYILTISLTDFAVSHHLLSVTGKISELQKPSFTPYLRSAWSDLAVYVHSRTAPPHAAPHRRRHQRAPGVSLLPQDLLMLLLSETTLPRQARAVGHAVRVRVLPPEVPHQELAHDA